MANIYDYLEQQQLYSIFNDMEITFNRLVFSYSFYFKFLASSIVSGNFCDLVSGQKSTEIAPSIAEPPNSNAGSDAY